LLGGSTGLRAAAWASARASALPGLLPSLVAAPSGWSEWIAPGSLEAVTSGKVGAHGIQKGRAPQVTGGIPMHAQNDNPIPSSTTTWWRWGTPPRSGMRRIIAHGSTATSMPSRAYALPLVSSWSASAPLRSSGVPFQRRLSGSRRCSWWRRWQASRSPPGSWLSLVPHLPEPEPALLALVWRC
jgi:hypothetical protein